MELDIFLPELDLAFEYQGEQHFMSFSHWAGDDGLKNIQDRDAEKRAACGVNHITLIEVPYRWDGSEAELKKMIDAGAGPATHPESTNS